jgi:polysaccharide biosynthesis protein PslH
MNILFVSAILPYPLYSGGQIRIYNLLKSLSRRHTITLFSFIRSNQELQHVPELSFCKSVSTFFRGHAWQPKYIARAVSGKYPFLLSTYNNVSMREGLIDALRSNSFDVIHIEPGYVWPSIPQTNLPIVVGEHNIEHMIYSEYVRRFPVLFLRPLLRLDVQKLMTWEKIVWQKASYVTTVSLDDKKHIESMTNKKKNIRVVPNGVNLSQFTYKPKQKVMNEAYTFLFVGNFSWMQNQDAVTYLLKSIWPCLSARYPKSALHIVGRQVPQTLKQLAVSERVVFLEHVDTISHEFHASDMLLAPIRIGGGTKYKILEAMACGVPVVTSSLGAMGLHVTHNTELGIADTTKDFVNNITEILENDRLRESLITKARKKIEQEYSWDRIAIALEHVWKSAYESYR